MDNKIAIYIRVSTQFQVDKDSLPMQREDLINYSKYILNAKEFVVFEDAGYSGKNTARPAYQEMLARIRAGEFTHLLVWKLDRISRNLLDFAGLYEELKKFNITFVSKNEQFDTSSAMGEAMLKIILVFAELERKLTSERVKATMISRASKGLWNGANMPLGYIWNEETKYPTPCPIESKTVKEIFNRYLKLKSCKKVAIEMNERGYETKRGGQWTDHTIGNILRNPFYKGTYRYNFRESARGKIKPEKEWVILDNNHEAIVDKKTWSECNQILDQNACKNRSLFRSGVHIHIFAQKLICQKCGAYMIPFKDKPRADGYTPSQFRCPNKTLKKCDSALLSDILLGPFVFSFIKNAINLSNNPIYDIKLFEEGLLEGTVFKNVAGLEEDGLQLLFIALYKQALTKKIEYNDLLKEKSTEKEEKFLKEKANKYQKEIKKYTNALQRLEELYLYSDDGISTLNYTLRKKEIENNIEKNEKLLKDYYRMNNELENVQDMGFLINFENFLINDNIKSEGEFNFREVAMNVNNTVLKDLIDLLIKEIRTMDKQILSIKFANGIEIKFKYK